MDKSSTIAEPDYSVLRPPQDVFNVTHPDHYIQNGTGPKAMRKIFYGVEWNEEEKEKLKAMYEEIANQNVVLPPNWSESETMRMVYDKKADYPKCVESLKKYIEYFNDPKWFTYDQEIEDFLKMGALYIAGKDKQYRPIIIANLEKFKVKEEDRPKLIRSIVYALSMIKRHAFVPGHVENWIMMIDVAGVGLTNFPIQVIKDFVQLTQLYFSASMEKTFVLNPTFMINALWGVMQGMLEPETASRAEIIKKDQTENLFKTIDPDQIEQKYGGTAENLTTFWPPTRFAKEPPYTAVPERHVVQQKKETSVVDVTIVQETKSSADTQPQSTITITMETKSPEHKREEPKAQEEKPKAHEEKPKAHEEKPKETTTTTTRPVHHPPVKHADDHHKKPETNHLPETKQAEAKPHVTSKYVAKSYELKQPETKPVETKPQEDKPKEEPKKTYTSTYSSYKPTANAEAGKPQHTYTKQPETKPSEEKPKEPAHYTPYKYGSSITTTKPTSETKFQSPAHQEAKPQEKKPDDHAKKPSDDLSKNGPTHHYVSKYTYKSPQKTEEQVKTHTEPHTNAYTTTKPTEVKSNEKKPVIGTTFEPKSYKPAIIDGYKPKEKIDFKPKEELPEIRDDNSLDLGRRTAVANHDLGQIISNHASFLVKENMKIAYPAMIFRTEKTSFSNNVN